MKKPPIIYTNSLKLNDLPPQDSKWSEISKFALSFDPLEIENLNWVHLWPTPRVVGQMPTQKARQQAFSLFLR